MNHKKTVKINYVDFWPELDKKDNFFYNILAKFYQVEISDSPDYVFCSCFGNEHFKYTNCIKILFLGENIIPDFNLYDYAMGFHYIDFEDRYLRLPLYALYSKKIIDAAFAKHTFSRDYYLEKKKFCNYVISNPYAARERDSMIEALNRYQAVDSGGRYRNNVGGPVADKMAFVKAYRFTMAFENSSMNGYTTEKILEAFAGDTIPIYWGSSRVAEEFNPKAFINCHEYPNFEAVVQRVKEINEDENQFLEMMMTPMVTEKSQASTYLKENYADDFLCHIFEQNRDVAIRRNMVYIGRDYQKRLADDKKVENVLNVVRKPIHLINKKKAQWKSRKERTQ